MPNIHAIGGGCNDDCCGCEKIDYLPESSYWTQLSGTWTFSGFPLYTAAISGAGVAIITDASQGFDASVSPSKRCKHAGIAGPWKIRWTVNTLSTGDQCGVVFSYQDEDNYWWIEYHQAAFGAADSVYIKRKIAGVDETVYSFSSTTLFIPSDICYAPSNDYGNATLRFSWQNGDTGLPDYEFAEDLPWGNVGLMVAATSGTVTFSDWSISRAPGYSSNNASPCVCRERCLYAREPFAPQEVDVSIGAVANGTCFNADCANLGTIDVTATMRAASVTNTCEWRGTFGTYGSLTFQLNTTSDTAYWESVEIANGTEGGDIANVQASDNNYHTITSDADGIIDAVYTYTLPLSSTYLSIGSSGRFFQWERRLDTTSADSQSVVLQYWDWCTNEWTQISTATFGVQSSTSANDTSQSFTIPTKAVDGDGSVRLRVYGTGLDAEGATLYVDLARASFVRTPYIATLAVSYTNLAFYEACNNDAPGLGRVVWSKSIGNAKPQTVGQIVSFDANDITTNDYSGLCNFSSTTVTVTGDPL